AGDDRGSGPLHLGQRGGHGRADPAFADADPQHEEVQIAFVKGEREIPARRTPVRPERGDLEIAVGTGFDADPQFVVVGDAPRHGRSRFHVRATRKFAPPPARTRTRWASEEKVNPNSTVTSSGLLDTSLSCVTRSSIRGCSRESAFSRSCPASLIRSTVRPRTTGPRRSTSTKISLSPDPNFSRSLTLPASRPPAYSRRFGTPRIPPIARALSAASARERRCQGALHISRSGGRSSGRRSGRSRRKRTR